MRALRAEGGTVRAWLASFVMLGALAVALLPAHSVVLAVILATLGAAGVLALTARAAARLMARHRGLWVVIVLAGLVVAWVLMGVRTAHGAWPPFFHIPAGLPYGRGSFDLTPVHYLPTAWPWQVGRLPLPLLVLAIVGAGGGFVLIADAVRVQIGLARPPRSLWRSMTATPSRRGRIAVRACSGAALIGVAAFLGISLMSRYVAEDPLLATLGMLAVGGISALLVAGPVAVGLAMRLDVDQTGRAREDERRRFAAHLHDSVLQTLALIQRQAGDPGSVARLARRQEHDLRAWMAGESSLNGDTVATAVRNVVSDLEDEHGVKVELTAIGDTRLEAGSEELVAAAREALRNVARHAPGAPVTIFLDITAGAIELFIRDDGPGFDFVSVPLERRGLRDSVIGRMQLAGGIATVESTPGEGTEVVLILSRAAAGSPKAEPRANGTGRPR